MRVFAESPIRLQKGRPFPPRREKMRKVLSKDEIMQLIKKMPEEGNIWIEDSDERKESYKKILESGERTELVKLIKTLHTHKQKQKLDIPHNEVVPFISGQLQQ